MIQLTDHKRFIVGVVYRNPNSPDTNKVVVVVLVVMWWAVLMVPTRLGDVLSVYF